MLGLLGRAETLGLTSYHKYLSPVNCRKRVAVYIELAGSVGSNLGARRLLSCPPRFLILSSRAQCLAKADSGHNSWDIVSFHPPRRRLGGGVRTMAIPHKCHSQVVVELPVRPVKYNFPSGSGLGRIGASFPQENQ
jgi:hypothetical protein